MPEICAHIDYLDQRYREIVSDSFDRVKVSWPLGFREYMALCFFGFSNPSDSARLPGYSCCNCRFVSCT